MCVLFSSPISVFIRILSFSWVQLIVGVGWGMENSRWGEAGWDLELAVNKFAPAEVTQEIWQLVELG